MWMSMIVIVTIQIVSYIVDMTMCINLLLFLFFLEFFENIRYATIWIIMTIIMVVMSVVMMVVSVVMMVVSVVMMVMNVIMVVSIWVMMVMWIVVVMLFMSSFIVVVYIMIVSESRMLIQIMCMFLIVIWLLDYDSRYALMVWVYMMGFLMIMVTLMVMVIIVCRCCNSCSWSSNCCICCIRIGWFISLNWQLGLRICGLLIVVVMCWCRVIMSVWNMLMYVIIVVMPGSRVNINWLRISTIVIIRSYRLNRLLYWSVICLDWSAIWISGCYRLDNWFYWWICAIWGSMIVIVTMIVAVTMVVAVSRSCWFNWMLNRWLYWCLYRLIGTIWVMLMQIRRRSCWLNWWLNNRRLNWCIMSIWIVVVVRVRRSCWLYWWMDWLLYWGLYRLIVTIWIMMVVICRCCWLSLNIWRRSRLYYYHWSNSTKSFPSIVKPSVSACQDLCASSNHIWSKGKLLTIENKEGSIFLKCEFTILASVLEHLNLEKLLCIFLIDTRDKTNLLFVPLSVLLDVLSILSNVVPKIFQQILYNENIFSQSLKSDHEISFIF